MTKAERQLRHQARLEQKAIREREMFERQRPWGELKEQVTTRATSLLEQPHLLPEQESLNRHEVVLRLWNYPSFTPFKAWLVYGSRWDDSGCFLREVTWDRIGDLERIHQLTAEELAIATPTPTIEIRTVELRRDEFEDRFDELRGLSLPIFMENNMMGLDGETFGIAVGDWWLNAKLSWWSDGPPEWKEATEWFHRTRTYFEQQLQVNPTNV